MAADPSGALDWDMIKAQLDSIDDAWKQPRFDSLPYVVEVITSPNIEASVERLRETRDAISSPYIAGASFPPTMYYRSQTCVTCSSSMKIQRIAEEMAAYMPALKRSYIFGGICSVSAAAFIKAVTNMEAINMLGVRQVNRNCIALQQALASLVASSGEFLEERLDRVRTYYDLLTIPFEALIALVPENDAIFSLSEYTALLKVNVPGREIPTNAVQQIAKLLAPTR